MYEVGTRLTVTSNRQSLMLSGAIQPLFMIASLRLHLYRLS